MAKKKKQEITSDETPPQPGALRTLRRQLYRPVTLITAAVVIAVAFGWPALRKLLPRLDARREYRLQKTQIHVTQAPHWVPHNLVEQVVGQADLPEQLSLLDENLARDLAMAFALHPWVEEVVSVKKSFPASVEVKLNYRRPVAMVQVKQGLYPIDVRGILLPPQDFSPSEAKAYPQIASVHSTPQGPAGSVWGDPVVEEAARLADELAPYWKKLQLAQIICPRQSHKNGELDAGVYTLSTVGGSEIVWGLAPGTDHPGELTTRQKIERLESYATKFGGVDQPGQRFQIDIRHWRDIRRKPISAERTEEDDVQR